MGQEKSCTTCGGYGDVYINVGTDDSPTYETRICSKCNGVGHTTVYGED